MIDTEMKQALASIDFAALKKQYDDQNEALIVEDFFPAALTQKLVDCLETLKPAINRNYIPGHKKGGSVSRFSLDQLAPVYGEVYKNPEFKVFLEQLTGEKLLDCPADDPHTYALYHYTEEGDHIGWHYDTSYYQGKRFTILFGLINESSCKLECELYRDDPDRDTVPLAVDLLPGTLVVFNGDKLWHRVTPLAANEHRVVLTMEYVNNLQMNGFKRFVSNMKDSIAYFGFKQVFGSNKKTPNQVQ